jgi:hypothetical protein
MNIVDVFGDKPTRWGLRGDPYLWDELEKLAIEKQPFQTEDDFSNFLKRAFEDIMGNQLIDNKIYYVERFDRGGMSRGKIDCHFWIETGFPLLVNRFNALIDREV